MTARLPSAGSVEHSMRSRDVLPNLGINRTVIFVER
jgi:hypothetical protein